MAVFNEVMLFAVCPYTCVHVYLLFFYATEYGEGVISFYPCCQGNRGSSGCQVAKVSVYKHFCVLVSHFIHAPLVSTTDACHQRIEASSGVGLCANW